MTDTKPTADEMIDWLEQHSAGVKRRDDYWVVQGDDGCIGFGGNLCDAIADAMRQEDERAE